MTTNRDPDRSYRSAAQTIPFFGEQLLKQVRTSLPGVVVEYDATTARARVQPAIDLLHVNGSSIPRPVLLDVPVIHPAGGGYLVHIPLDVGDPVLLLFSERDIAVFKRTLEVGPPPTDAIMPLTGAVAVPGFAQTPFTAQDGLSLQSADGSVHVRIHEGDVLIRGNVEITGTLRANGVDVGSTHRHGGVQSGSDQSGTPA